MKIRPGFVSNSSSASFVVFVDTIKDWQKEAILDAKGYSKDFLRWHDESPNWVSYADSWEIEYDKEQNIIQGSVFMDNFSFEEFFDAIGLVEDVNYECGE